MDDAPPLRHVYLHGFGSSPRSLKGTALAEAFAARGVELAQPDLNVPDFTRMTHSAALGVIDDLAGPDDHLALIGSSLGGYLAARWAELNPDRAHRLVLLCPGFDMIARWPILLGADAIARWRAHGALTFPGPDGRPTSLSWGFIEDALRHPPTPSVACPTLVLHGTRDEVVPIAGSRAWVAAHPNARLVEVDDDHALAASLSTLTGETLAFFGVTGTPG